MQMEWLGELIEQEEGVEKPCKTISVIARTIKEILVVIDDIDRFPPDEALADFSTSEICWTSSKCDVFAVYDRLLAEKIVSERFPFRGATLFRKKLFRQRLEITLNQ